MRVVLLFAVCVLTSGCMTAAQKREEAARQTQQMLTDSIDECKRESPNEVTQAIARATCVNQSMELIRPYMPNDLLDQENASRLAVAEKVQTKKITVIEANMQLAQIHSQLVGEVERRSLANRAVSAAESSARAQWAASGPVSCTKIGNTVSCY